MTALGLVTVLVGNIGERNEFALWGRPTVFTRNFIGIAILHTALLPSKLASVSLKPISCSLVSLILNILPSMYAIG